MNYEHDSRLNNIQSGQFRLWHDGQSILIPVGQSTTKPLMKETIPVNTKVYGEIQKGFFRPPWVDFTNTDVDTKRFDRFKLQTWREELPESDPDIGYYTDLEIKSIKIKYNVVFDCENFTGNASGQTWIDYDNDNLWFSEMLHFDNYKLQGLKGDFFIVCNPTIEQQNSGAIFGTGKELQLTNLPITIIVKRANIFNGNSEMSILLKNTIFNLNLTTFNFTILGGE